MMSSDLPVKVLMVCLGNICRSPTAEAVFRSRVQGSGLEQHIVVDSAGTSDWHVGHPPDRRSIRAAALRNYDLQGLRGRQVRRSDFEEFHYILAMDQANYRDLLRICPPALKERVSMFLSHGSQGVIDVPDPYHANEDGFEYVLDLVEDASDGLLQLIVEEQKLSRQTTDQDGIK